MSHFLEVLLGAIVWLVANVVYIDLKRKGIRGFTRFAAFWAGTPTTWITLFAVREGVQPTFHPPEDDEGEQLLEDIRRDRSLRAGEGEGLDEIQGRGPRGRGGAPDAGCQTELPISD